MTDKTQEKNEIKWVPKGRYLPDSYPCIAGRLSSRGKWIVGIGVHGPDLIHGFWEYWLDFEIPPPPEEVEIDPCEHSWEEYISPVTGLRSERCGICFVARPPRADEDIVF